MLEKTIVNRGLNGAGLWEEHFGWKHEILLTIPS